MGAAKTACLPCRKVKLKCYRLDEGLSCIRCMDNGLSCEVVPRRLGRQPGSKNRPKVSTSSSPPRPPDTRPPRGAARHGTAPYPSRLSTLAPRTADHATPDSDMTDTMERGGDGAGTSFGLLNVLASAANDLSKTATMTTPPQATSQPFDRASFLAQFRAAANSLDPDPYGGVAVLEEGLGELYKCEPFDCSGGDVVNARIDQPRLDVGDGYDVVSSGIVTEDEVQSLMAIYWDRIEPVGRVLDPSIHTIEFITTKSATLMSVVLMITAQSLPVSEHANSLVSRLDAHVEHLLAQTDRHGFQSIEICQALTLLCLFIGGHQLNRTWGLTAKSIAMAIELRLDASPPPAWALASSPHHQATTTALQRNVERLWILLVDWDRACAFIRARRPMIHDPPNVIPARLVEWCRSSEAIPSDPATAGTCSLLQVVLQLQFDAKRQLVQLSSGSEFEFVSHHSAINAALDSWQDTWFPLLPVEDQHRVALDIECMRLVLLMMPFEYGHAKGWPTLATTAGRDVCLSTALNILTRAMPIFAGTDPVLKVTSLYTYRYYRIAYAGFRTMRLICTAPGDRNKDVYVLSIIAALARRLVDLRLHANFASITVVLGRGLLHDARVAAQSRLAPADTGLASDSIPEFVVDGTGPLETASGAGVLADYPGWSMAALPMFPGLSEGIFGLWDPDADNWDRVGTAGW